VNLVFRPPRSRTPYELKKPETTRKTVKRSAARISPETLPVTAGPAPFERPREDYDIGERNLIDAIVNAPIPDRVYADVDPPRFTIPYVYESLTIQREQKREFSLKNELITLEDIDALGLYRGFAIVDPENKRNVQGFLHIPRSIKETGITDKRCYNLSEALTGLGGALHRATGVTLEIEEPVSLSSPYLSNFPVIYLTSVAMAAFRLDPAAAKSFGDYLRKGGFAILDNGLPWYSMTPAKASFLGLIADSLGDDAVIEPFDPMDALFHIFFSFEGNPPDGASSWADSIKLERPDYGDLLDDSKVNRLMKTVAAHPGALFAIKLDNRIVAIYSDFGYGHIWAQRSVRGKKKNEEFDATGSEVMDPSYAMGVNMILFAMRQKGGKTKLISEYSTPPPGSQ